MPGILAAALALACSDSPTEPGTHVNPELAAEANSSGLAATSGTLPQGAGSLTGPEGLEMDAAGEEFIQQLTTRNGTVLRTSGISIFAVPDEDAVDPVLDRVVFGAANTGSLESVEPGTFEIEAGFPQIDFIQQVEFGWGSVRVTGQEARTYADGGLLIIESVVYLPEVYTCELQTDHLLVDRCDYQIGLIRGTVEFTVTLDDGSIAVQETTDFELPIRRRTIFAREAESGS